MNKDFDNIKSILLRLRSDYISGIQIDEINQDSPITERDIVAELYYMLKDFYKNSIFNVHCEIKPASSENENITNLRKLPRIDVVILDDSGKESWISSAKKIQDRYKKGLIEARFSSIPIDYFHTAIEVKIQSNLRDAKDDIDLLKKIHETNNNCNCFFVLLNARGRRSDHNAIQKYADQNEICMIEYSCRK